MEVGVGSGVGLVAAAAAAAGELRDLDPPKKMGKRGETGSLCGCSVGSAAVR